jgi:hypothetical protein
MDSNTPDGAVAPARSRRRINTEPPPVDPAKRRIKIARAVALIGRTKCPVAAALRAVGLDRDHRAREDVAGLLDARGISRIKLGVRRVRFPETPSRVFEEFIPPHRNPNLPVAELMEVDPLGPEISSQPETSESEPRPTVTIRCKECSARFEARSFGAKFCSVKCRVYNWRV